MKRLLTVFVVMAAMVMMVMVSALPAVAAPPTKTVTCPELHTSNSGHNVGFFGVQGKLIGDCSSEGGSPTQEVEPRPYKANPCPPGEGDPPLELVGKCN